MTTEADAFAKTIEPLLEAFKQEFGTQPTIVSKAPGRVNLIGEHTDYNQGFVFPIAIDREIKIIARPKEEGDDMVEVVSLDYSQRDKFSLNNIVRQDEPVWTNYVRGAYKVFMDTAGSAVPVEAVISGDIPRDSGLSSSAALSVALIQLIASVSAVSLTKVETALSAQKIENEFVGVKCGIMDQFISALGDKDSALMIDCRSLEYTKVPLNLADRGYTVLVVHSGVERGLVDSKYNERREQCNQGIELLSSLLARPELTALRDVSHAEFQSVENQLPELIARRSRHVISENSRVKLAVEALTQGNLNRFGELMNASHNSLRDDYQVSTPELDYLVELTRAHPAVVGARMTGAGFGGCTVALVEADAIDDFKDTVIARYESATGRKSEVHECRAVSGASLVDL